MNTSRLMIGLILIAIAIAMFVFGGNEYSTAGAVALLVLGLASVAIARKSNRQSNSG